MGDFLEDVMRGIEQDITDAVFLFIEHDKNLMKRYLELAEQHGRGQLNQDIGKQVKKHFNLVNAGRNKNPRSKLIKDHQRFKPWPRPPR